MDYNIILDTRIGFFNVKLLVSEPGIKADYQVNLYYDNKLLESYDHESLDRAQEDYSTIRNTIKHVLCLSYTCARECVRRLLHT